MPEQVTENRRKAPPSTRSAPGDVDLVDLADDEWQDDGEDGDSDCDDGDEDELLTKFRRLQVSPLERLPMEIATGEVSYSRSERRKDAGVFFFPFSISRPFALFPLGPPLPAPFSPSRFFPVEPPFSRPPLLPPHCLPARHRQHYACPRGL